MDISLRKKNNFRHRLLVSYYEEANKNNKSILTVSNKCISGNSFSFKIKDPDTGKTYLVKPKGI